MYRLDFSQIPRRPRIQRVAEAEIRRLSHRTEDRGFFHHHGEFNVPPATAGHERLVVTFNPTIYISLGLSPAEQSDVQDHEMEHFEDFRGRADDLHRYLRGAVRNTRWDVLRTAWEWFNYYVREDARLLHIELRRDSIVMNPRPRSRAPY